MVINVKKSDLNSFVKINKNEAEQLKKAGKEKGASIFKKLSKVLMIAVVVAVVLSLVVIGAKRFANVSMSTVTDGIKGLVLKASPGEGFPYDIGGNTLVQSEIVGPYLALVEKDKLVYLNSHAKDIFKFEHNFVDPVLKTKNGRAVFFCEGTKDYVVTSSSELLYSLDKTADTLDGGIITADVGSKGNLAFATWSNEYACKISVLNQKLKKVFYYGFSSGRVVDLSLSDDGKYLCAAVIDAQNATIFTRLMVFDLSKSDPVSDIRLDSQSGVDVEFLSGTNIELITLSALYRYNFASKKDIVTTLDFSGNDLDKMTIDVPSGRCSLAIKQFSSNSDTVFLFNSSADKYKTVQTDSVKAISRSSKYTVCLSDYKMYCIKNSSRKLFEINLETNIDDILVDGSSAYVFTGNRIYKLGLSHFTKFEIS